MTNATIFLINATRVKPVTHVKNILIHVTNTSFIKFRPRNPQTQRSTQLTIIDKIEKIDTLKNRPASYKKHTYHRC